MSNKYFFIFTIYFCFLKTLICSFNAQLSCDIEKKVCMHFFIEIFINFKKVCLWNDSFQKKCCIKIGFIGYSTFENMLCLKLRFLPVFHVSIEYKASSFCCITNSSITFNFGVNVDIL